MSMTAQFRPPITSVDGEEFAFPSGTPLAAMTDRERAEYWRHQSKIQQRRLSVALAQIRQAVDQAAHV